MKKKIEPNTILIGAQKCATTSLYNWIKQHPEVCGPTTLKDYAFFINDLFFKKGIELFENDYLKENFNDQKIILHGCVNYIFFKHAIERIYDFNPDVKLILVIRNPVDRAISAYNYQKKMRRETLSFKEAIEKEKLRAEGTLQQKSDLTYIAHGLYGKQIELLLSYFKRSQLHVIFYEDIVNNKEKTAEKVFNFLEIDSSFSPVFKKLNKTGKVRFNQLQNIVFSQNAFKKKLVKYLVDPIIPISKRIKIKNSFREWNTSDEKNNLNYQHEKVLIGSIFDEDINKLETLLKVDLSKWKSDNKQF